jgi:hypothetical protein
MPAPIAQQCMDVILKHLKKMNNDLEVITEELSNFEQLHRFCQVLPDAHTLAEYKGMNSQVLENNYCGAPQYSKWCRTEMNNILKSVLLHSTCSKIDLIGCAKYGAIRCIGHSEALFQYTSTLKPYSTGVIIIIFISPSTIQLTLFLLHN